jgi:Tol biopolymer transport system component
MKKIAPLLLIACLIGACLPQDVQVPQSPLLPFLERKAGLIAYIGLDGNVYTSDQAGRNLIQVTDDAQLPDNQSGAFRFYQYPTWSPDGGKLAIVGVSGEGEGQTLSEMFVKVIEEDGINKVYSSETSHPFYLYWSPDNKTVGFLATDSSGQSIVLKTISVEGGDPTILDDGSPYYWSWAPDGTTMIVHTGSAASSTPEHLAFLQTESGITEDALDTTPATFQAPAWSPDGNRILLTRVNDDDKNEIVVADSTGAFEKAIAEFPINASFAWSPDSQLIAFIEGDREISAGTLGKLHAVELETGEDFFQAEDVYAFFWSPNSRRLAYLKPRLVEGETADQQVLLLELHMLDTVSGETKQLFTFQPTNQFSAVLPYFDQYHQSVTIWSPDSNNLVLSFVDQQGNPGIAVVAASGQLEPRVLTGGYLAFWSWK